MPSSPVTLGMWGGEKGTGFPLGLDTALVVHALHGYIRLLMYRHAKQRGQVSSTVRPLAALYMLYIYVYISAARYLVVPQSHATAVTPDSMPRPFRDH